MQHLENFRLPLDETAQEHWRKEYGITAIYLSDIAAGALIEVPRRWTKDDAPTRVSTGLRHLVQELWRLDLIRPVVGVFWSKEHKANGKEESPAVQALTRLTWDQEQHRGDFALRKAENEKAAKRLLWSLLGDTMGSLDDAAREDRVGKPEVIEALQQERATLQENADQPWAEPLDRLIDVLLKELGRVKRMRSEGRKTEPRLEEALQFWLRSEGVSHDEQPLR